MTYRLYSLATTEYTNYNFALPNTRYCAFIAISSITSLWTYIDVIILFIINLGVCYLYHTFLPMLNTSNSKNQLNWIISKMYDTNYRLTPPLTFTIFDQWSYLIRFACIRRTFSSTLNSLGSWFFPSFVRVGFCRYIFSTSSKCWNSSGEIRRGCPVDKAAQQEKLASDQKMTFAILFD